MKTASRQNTAASAALNMVCASISFAIMGAFVKALHRLPAWEVTFFRAFVNLIALMPWALANPKLVATWRKEPVALFVRGVSGGLSAVLYFYAIEHIRLADAVMLNQSSPILVLILSAIFLGERLSMTGVAWVLVAFFGMGFILKPSLNVASSTESLAYLAGFGSTGVAAIAYLSIKVATRSIPTRLIVLTFAIVASLMSFIPMLVFFIPPTPKEWLMLGGAGLFATIAQELMTRGYAGLPASVASPILLVTVLCSTLLGWTFWGEIPDRWSIVGMIMITTGLIAAYRVSRVSPTV